MSKQECNQELIPSEGIDGNVNQEIVAAIYSQNVEIHDNRNDIVGGKDLDERIQKNSAEEAPTGTSYTANDDMSSACESVGNSNSSSISEPKDGATKISMNVTKDEDISNKARKQKIHCIAVGNAPLMKRTKFLISYDESFGIFQQRLLKMLQLPKASSLFMYIQQSFVPSPDDLIGDLGKFFAVNEELKIHYSIQEAWG